MEKMDTLSEYKKFCDDCCNRIFQIRQEYERKRKFLQIDFDNGLISEEEYQRFMAVSIGEFVDSKYTLSQEDVTFIRSYAHLNRRGELMATLLKPEYLDQLHLLETIYHSVQIYTQYGKLPLEDRKNQFREAVMHSYKNTVAALSSKLNVLKRTYGTRYKDTTQYQEYSKSFSDLKKETEAKSRVISTCTEEELQTYMGQFFGIDYRYYEWFKKMSLKEEFETGFIFEEHVRVAQNAVSGVEEMKSLHQNREALEKELLETMQAFSSFSEGMLKFDMEDYTSKGKIPFLKFFGAKKDLFAVFSSLSEIPGVLSYICTFEPEKDGVVPLNACYANYVQLTYSGSVEQIDAEAFIKRFMSNVLHYYQTKINELKKSITEAQSAIDKQTQALSTVVERNAHQAELQRSIVTQLEDFKHLHLDDLGLTEEGIARIYSDLKDIAYAEYTMPSSEPLAAKKLN